METWSGSEPETLWFVCRSVGVWKQKANFWRQKNNATPSNSPEIPVQSDLWTEEMWNTPRTPQEYSLENFPQTEELCDVIDTYPDRDPGAETSSEQPNNSPTNPRSSN